MYYDINVSLNGRHFFATHERSCTTETDARRVYDDLREAFRPENGFAISVTRYDTIGTMVVQNTEVWK